jgi:8-oxo-dGTP diphosphatase
MNAPGTDRRRTPRGRGRHATLTPLGAHVEPALTAVTSASVVALTDTGLLVLADLPRGLDLPGGHLQTHERTAEAAVRREAWEEARIRLGALRVVEVIQSDLYGADDLTYMLVYAGRVTHLAPWDAPVPSTGPAGSTGGEDGAEDGDGNGDGDRVVGDAGRTDLAGAAEVESAGRVLLNPADFLARYRGGRPELMGHLVAAGLAALAGT